MSHWVLGLNTHHGDAAAALVGPDGPIAAVAEERLNRIKHFAGFPSLAVAEVLRIAGCRPSELAAIAVARSPRANLGAKARFVASHASRALRLAHERLGVHRATGDGIRAEVARALGVPEAQLQARVYRVEHHLAHVASAFYWSPFQRAGALSVDGAGDFATALWALGEGDRIGVLARNHWPHSLGIFYSALCQFIGFDQYGEEFKVMGLAAYGRPRYLPLLRELVAFSPERGLRLNLKYFVHQLRIAGDAVIDGRVQSAQHYGPRMSELLGQPRKRGDALEERHADIAASMQARYEEVFCQMVEYLTARTQTRELVFAGGCALNSVANGRMLRERYADRVYFQPAATDDGTAMGAAHFVLHQKLGVPRGRAVEHAYWGSSADERAIAEALSAQARPWQRLSEDDLITRVVEALAGGRIVGWFQGREEWGPRALGNRSILCNPAWPGMKATLNARIKNREAFRPFAPAIREEDLTEVFEGTHPVPFMIIVYAVRHQWRQRLPAITHEDGSGRVQTVSERSNPLFWKLLGAFRASTGVPTLLNTSFNENEPIVHTPAQALDCFERTQMDALAIGPYWLEKTAR